MEITKKEFLALSKEQQDLMVEAGVVVLEEKGLDAVDIKTITDQAFAPMQEKLNEMGDAQKKFFEKASAKEVEINHDEIAGLQLKQLAGKALDVEEKAVLGIFANENTATPEDGAHTVTQEFVRTLTQIAIQDDEILGRLTKFTIGKGSNALILPVTETTPFSPAGKVGITAYWGAENATKTQSKPIFGQITLTLEKLYTLTPVTDELLEDSVIDMASYVKQDQANKINGKLLDALIVNGSTNASATNGVSPLVTAVCRIVTSRATALSVEFADINAMYANILPSSLKSGKVVWIANPKVKTAIFNLSDDAGNLIFLNKGVSGSPESALFGLPYLETMYAPSLGTTGDLMLVDLSQVILAQKAIKSDSSIHFYFDQDVTCFRTVSRWASRVWLSDSIEADSGDQYTYVAVLGPAGGS